MSRVAARSAASGPSRSAAAAVGARRSPGQARPAATRTPPVACASSTAVGHPCARERARTRARTCTSAPGAADPGPRQGPQALVEPGTARGNRARAHGPATPALTATRTPPRQGTGARRLNPAGAPPVTQRARQPTSAHSRGATPMEASRRSAGEVRRGTSRGRREMPRAHAGIGSACGRNRPGLLSVQARNSPDARSPPGRSRSPSAWDRRQRGMRVSIFYIRT